MLLTVREKEREDEFSEWFQESHKTYADCEIEKLVVLSKCFDHSGELSISEISAHDLFIVLIVHHYESDENAGDTCKNRVLHVTSRVLNHLNF